MSKLGCGGVGNAVTDPPDSGTLRAVRWNDISGALLAARLDIASGRLHYDYFNAGVKFDSNARYPEEPAVVAMQASHAMLIGVGAVLRPHFHWLQEQAAVPNFLLGYKLTNYGEATVLETDWSNYTFLTPSGNAFAYVAGVLAQITKFPEVEISGLTISGSIDVVLFRDTGNASGLFAGADPVATDVTVKYNDSHVQLDSDGSRQEFVK